MNNIVEEMRELYLQDLKPWIVSFSGGKDSSLCLEYTFQMLLSLPKEKRHKQVHVLMVNTLAETPMMSGFMEKSMKYVQKAADENDLPIIAEIVTPKMEDRFFYNTLGRGLLVISPKSRGRWCSNRMKIKPVRNTIRRIIDSSPSEVNVGISYSSNNQMSMLNEDTTRVVQRLGTRLDESVARAASIRSHELDKDSKFSRHSEFTDEILCYMPIKYMVNDEVFLSLPSRFSWGIDVSEMEVQYGQGFFLECSLQDAGEDKKACGVGSRQGCWTCPAMGLNKDKMLDGLINEGHTQLSPLYEWKRQLIEMRNDVRYREFERRQWRKQHQKRLASLEEERKRMRITDYFQQGFDVSDYMEMKKQEEYESFERAEDYEYLPGGFSVEGRKLMLEKLLYIQEETGYDLISDEEVQAIIDYWNEEKYFISRSEVVPQNHSYDGPLVLDKEGFYNSKESTTDTPYFEIHVDFEYGRDEMVEFIESRKKKTGKSFYYFTTHCDLGEDEQFVWNQAIFIVCVPGITEEKEARKLIYDWLNPQLDQPPVDHSFKGCVERQLKKVYQALNRGEQPYQEMVFLKKALDWISQDEPELSKKIRTLLNGYEVAC
jgi:DNA sulfur modification protein DndC